MPSTAQSSPPLSPRSHTLPLHFEFEKTEELDTDTYHTQQQALQEWFFASIPGERSNHLLPTLHRYTLVHGLNVLRQRMEDLVNLDLKLYHTHACLLSDREAAEGAYLYAGLCLSSFPADILEESSRTFLEFLIWRKVAEYDDIAKSVRTWKKSIDDRIWLNRDLEMRLKTVDN